MDKKHDTIFGVKCEVKDCVYHCCDDECAAPGIRVGCGCGCTAEKNSDTSCDTFRRNVSM